jgi:hypothetical protein
VPELPLTPPPEERDKFRGHAAWRVILSLALGAIFALLVFSNATKVYALVTILEMNDFGIFYRSALAHREGRDLYIQPPRSVSIGGGTILMRSVNLNPPHFHLLLLPLASLPPRIALTMWGLFSVASLALSLRLIVREAGIALSGRNAFLAVVALLAFIGTQTVLATGQLVFLLLLPLTLAWLNARRHRWTSAGGWLGLAMSVKPFLLIFLPYLLLRRRFRAAVASIAVMGGCFGVGLAVFGMVSHVQWLEQLATVQWVWSSMNASVLGFLSRLLEDNNYYAPLTVAPHLVKPLWIVLAGSVAVVTLAASASATESGTDRAFALLLLGSLLVSPVGWVYYFWLPLGPMVLLGAQWCTDRTRPHSAPQAGPRRWRHRLLVAALPGLVTPTAVTYFFQPAPWATLILGCLYFWSTLAIWGALLMDWRWPRATSPILRDAGLLK